MQKIVEARTVLDFLEYVHVLIGVKLGRKPG